MVVGAGVAGLAAARELSGAGLRVCIIEARQRLGGRVFTLHPAAVPLPIELGAEFVHGETHTTFSIVERAALLAYELPDDHWWSRNGRLERVPDFWGKLQKLRARIPAGRDQSFADFLRSQRHLAPRLRELALGFVEGYHAAHADRISALALRAADSEQDEDGGGNKQFRIGSGYDALVGWLHAGLDPDRTALRLGEPVEEIEWRAQHVAVRTARAELQARRAVVTIPVGVWKSGGIRFTPALRDKERAVARLESGHVVKIVFRFRERFWDAGRNFIHGNGPVPTWWTTAPVRAPLLTAWAGGHAADALLAESAEERIERALEAMAATFATKRATIDGLLDATYTHDWQSDPFSRGAYSYAAVGGSGAHDALARPIKSTLFFAGEATNGEETGTVAGAIESGRRAAKQALKM